MDPSSWQFKLTNPNHSFFSILLLLFLKQEPQCVINMAKRQISKQMLQGKQSMPNFPKNEHFLRVNIRG